MSAKIPRDPLYQSLTRLSNRLSELGAWRDRERVSLGAGEIRLAPNTAWTPIREGDSWSAKAEQVEIRFASSVPGHWTELPVHCRLRLGGEALLFLNDLPFAGLNSFQDEHPVLAIAKGQETLRFHAEVVPHGLFGTPIKQPQVELACLLVPDLDVRLLYDDLAAALDAAQYHHSARRHSVAERLVDALQSAFAEILLPRADTEQYLARIAAISKSRAHETFYENQESLASLWESWEFRSATDSLSGEQRKHLREIRKRFALQLESIRKDYPTVGGVWLTGHAHIDLAWLWPLEETQRKSRRTFYNVVNLLERYPELHFNQSSAQLYAWIERNDPPLFDKIRARVREGSWEIVGGMWVEPDGNLPSGESWARQLLFGQRYFESRFAKRAKVAWLPDSFGFTGNLPQLLQSAGIPFFFTHKLTWNERNPFPFDLYWWEGIDRSRVLAHSFNNPLNGYNSRLTAQEIAETWHNFSSKRRHDFTLLAFGYGDGGGGPSNEMLERFSRLREFPGMPRLRMGNVTDFYESVSTKSLPVWVGEQYLEYHRATYTTQGRMKSWHRQLEHALVETETAATLAFVRQRSSYPKEQLDRLWQLLLLNQFHDILPGSSIHSVYERAHADLQNALTESDRLRSQALAIANSRPSSEPDETSEGQIWNLDIHDRTLVAEITARTSSAVRLLTSDGCEAAIQRIDENRILVEAENIVVPGLGVASVIMASGTPKELSSPLQASLGEMENELLRIQFGADGTLASIYDKECQREVLAGRGNQLWLFTDIPRQFDAWDIDASYPGEGIELVACPETDLVESGPLRAALRFTRRYDSIEIVQTYRLRRLSRVLEIHNLVHWSGRRRLLRALFPFDIQTHEMWSETAFGAVARPNHRNTPVDQARFEVPAHRWIDLSEPSYGVSLLNNAKYGHSADGNVLGISLLRSPIYPDPYADEGDHEFLYAIYPHRGTWRNGTVRAARELHHPLRFTKGRPSSRFPSLLKLSGVPVELACLKRAEDSEEVLVRLYEPHGNRGQAILESALRLERAAVVNILEEQLQELPIQEARRLTISFTPFQVISLRLSIGD